MLHLTLTALLWTVSVQAGESNVWQPPSPLTIDADQIEPFTIAPLILRDGDRLVGVTGEDLRVLLLERGREHGWPLLGAENLLFGKDGSDQARFVLGGEITDVYDAEHAGREGIAVDVRWEVLDRRSDAVVYIVVTRGWVRPHEDAAADLLASAFDGLLARQGLVDALAGSVTAIPAGQPLAVARCGDRPLQLPTDLSETLSGVVRVVQGAGSGSGVLISPDGFVLTAAHVVDGGPGLQLVLSGGMRLDATLVSAQVDADVALLKLPGTGYACLGPASDSKIGDPVFLLGSPLGEALEGSVSSGVISGTRTIDGVRLVQTDAAANPGNSGGPLVDARGQVVGLLRSKIVGADLEGLAFAVAIDEALSRLGVTFADASAPFDPAPQPPARPETVVDEPDHPIEGRDARLCAYRTKRGPPVDVLIDGVVVALGQDEYACIDVKHGNRVIGLVQGIGRQGTDLRPGQTAYFRVMGRLGVTPASTSDFEAALADGMIQVEP